MVDMLKFINLNYLHSQLPLVNYDELLSVILGFPGFRKKNPHYYFSTCTSAHYSEHTLVSSNDGRMDTHSECAARKSP